ncbi:unnamed protein product, partial [Mesorhabditis spiculigera]
MRPSASSGNLNAGETYHPQMPTVQSSDSIMQPQQPNPEPYIPRVGVVDSLDLYPQPEQPEQPEEPVYPPVTPAPSGPATTDKSIFEINYCDQNEFTDQVLAQYGLARVEYFIYNTSCSHIFFQCAIGQTFLLRCPSEQEAFDRATVNCNFRNSVKFCPEYDHVMHCTIREQCGQDEYACCSQPQKCLPLIRRCDGHSDCSDGDDENNCPSCQRNEFACVKSGRCIEASKRCDGNPDDCEDGTNMDEIGCSRNETCVGKFMCHASFEGPSCIDYSLHCDAHNDCQNGEDEVNCKVSEAKYILCENQKQQVLRSQWCDGTGDCADGSDEKYYFDDLLSAVRRGRPGTVVYCSKKMKSLTLLLGVLLGVVVSDPIPGRQYDMSYCAGHTIFLYPGIFANGEPVGICLSPLSNGNPPCTNLPRKIARKVKSAKLTSIDACFKLYDKTECDSEHILRANKDSVQKLKDFTANGYDTDWQSIGLCKNMEDND